MHSYLFKLKFSVLGTLLRFGVFVRMISSGQKKISLFDGFCIGIFLNTKYFVVILPQRLL